MSQLALGAIVQDDRCHRLSRGDVVSWRQHRRRHPRESEEVLQLRRIEGEGEASAHGDQIILRIAYSVVDKMDTQYALRNTQQSFL